ncbi:MULTISPECIES: calcium/sodium antiporter [Aeromonas]|jgi:cation:H+ antiporter|uniref:Calcium/sodium antiporter n=1 Tax=Aeromonas rivipollensis TaxID=948519 RepID=A0AAP6VYE1_9GAMM|nr:MULTISPECIES: calcium/sodium antiporter [Aeromonas]QIY87179.1 calcium/sodium antiporter [Aeromonas hydrophila]MBS4700914.1 calcium/sodium antiporter [Aeromonas media]MCE9926822.1 calcium/sodium antiporter [Aeromonas media]MCE9945956.1 calcium/sodium antiporter [Aeromonas rivipollensis]MCE9955369.1 calcium/sodium antiporter [Aeromonas rivipollensis]
MTLAFVALIAGLALLVWSADKFVDGAAATARYAGMPPLLIGMVIIGFGTSAPEMVVSALASMQGNPGLALGNAYGSNITNIALILGLTALISPIAVSSQVVRKEIPILLGITLLTGALLIDGHLGRGDALILGGVFIVLLGWSIWTGIKGKGDALDEDVNVEIDSEAMPLKKAIFWLIVGLVLLVGASRLLVWGAVTIAQAFGISDLVIGLTIVAVGTSLPELASSLMAIKKKEHDLALGNVLGSNLFNTLAVVGIAAGIAPLDVDPAVLSRDWSLMMGLTLLLLVMCLGRKGQGRINRVEGGILLCIFVAYTGWLLTSQF